MIAKIKRNRPSTSRGIRLREMVFALLIATALLCAAEAALRMAFPGQAD